MKATLLFASLVFAGAVHAEEADPVAKLKLAIGEADLVLELIEDAAPDDPLLDKMCLRLGSDVGNYATGAR